MVEPLFLPETSRFLPAGDMGGETIQQKYFILPAVTLFTPQAKFACETDLSFNVQHIELLIAVRLTTTVSILLDLHPMCLSSV